MALSWVKKRSQNRTEPVVICGVALKVLTAAETLLRAGIDPSRIVCVMTDPEDKIEGCSELAVSQQLTLRPLSPLSDACLSSYLVHSKVL